MAKKQQDLKSNTVQELQSAIEVLDRELYALRTELATQRKLEKPHLLKEKRRHKARILTMLTQKQKEAV